MTGDAELDPFATKDILSIAAEREWGLGIR